jgi:hypothetical protein
MGYGPGSGERARDRSPFSHSSADPALFGWRKVCRIMGELTPYRLKKGDIEAGTECQARDGYLNIQDEVVRCPQCGSYTHRDCWQRNGNRCPRSGCEGAGVIARPTSSQTKPRYQFPYQLPSRYLFPLTPTQSARVLLSRTCGRDGGRFQLSDSVVRCPVCGTPYHDHCWRANGDRCSQPGCTGSGRVFSLVTTSSLGTGTTRISTYTPIQRQEEGCLGRIGRAIGCLLALIGLAVVLLVLYLWLHSAGILAAANQHRLALGSIGAVLLSSDLRTGTMHRVLGGERRRLHRAVRARGRRTGWKTGNGRR